MRQESNKSKRSFTPEKMMKLKLSASFILRLSPKSLGIRMANLSQKIRVSSASEATGISFCCQESRAPLSALTHAKPRTSSELMREQPKFRVTILNLANSYP